MRTLSITNGQQNNIGGFDMKRLSRSKDTVDVCPNTLRQYNREGLPFYKRGKAVFFSASELEQFIRNPDTFKKPARRGK